MYDIPEWDVDDGDDDNNYANQQLETSTEIGAETFQYTNVIQEPFQVARVAEIEILIEYITIDLGDLPRYNPPEGWNDDGDVQTDEDKWDIEDDDSDDSDDLMIITTRINVKLWKKLILIELFCFILYVHIVEFITIPKKKLGNKRKN